MKPIIYLDMDGVLAEGYVPMPNSEDNMKDMTHESNQLEELVFKALSARGEVLPQTVSEVARAEEHLEQNPPEIPESLKDTRQLLERIKARKIGFSEKEVM